MSIPKRILFGLVAAALVMGLGAFQVSAHNHAEGHAAIEAGAGKAGSQCAGSSSAEGMKACCKAGKCKGKAGSQCAGSRSAKANASCCKDGTCKAAGGCKAPKAGSQCAGSGSAKACACKQAGKPCQCKGAGKAHGCGKSGKACGQCAGKGHKAAQSRMGKIRDLIDRIKARRAQ